MTIHMKNTKIFFIAIFTIACLGMLSEGLTWDQKTKSLRDGTKEKMTVIETGENRQRIQSRLDRIKAKMAEIEVDKSLGEELKKNALDSYRQAQSFLNKSLEYQSLTHSYQKTLESASDEVQKLKDGERRLLDNKAPDFSTMSTQELDSELARKRAEQAMLSRTLERYENAIIEMRKRPDLARSEQAQTKKRLDEIEQQIVSLPIKSDAGLMNEASRTLLESRRILAADEINMLEMDILSQPARLELLMAERDLTATGINQLQSEIKTIEKLISDRRAQEAEKARVQAEQARKEALTKSPVITSMATKNIELSEELLTVAKDAKQVTPDKQLKELQLSQLEDTFNRSRFILEKTSLRVAGGKAVREQKKILPALIRDNEKVTARWRGKISEAESRIFEISMEQRELADRELYLSDLVDKYPDISRDEKIRNEVLELLENRQQLLKKLKDSYGGFIKLLRELESVQAQIQTTAEKLKILLERWLLWIPSSSPVGYQTFANLPGAVKWFLSPLTWLELMKSIWTDVQQNVILYFIMVAMLSIFIKYRRVIEMELDTVSDKIRRPDRDHLGFTLTAIGLIFLRSLPVALIIGFIGWRLTHGATEAGEAFGSGLVSLSALTFLYYFFMFLCKPSGISEMHLKWRQTTLSLIRRHLRWLFIILFLTSFVVEATESLSNGLISDSLGRLAYITGMLAQGIFIYYLVRPKGGIPEYAITNNPNTWFARLRFLWYPLVISIPLFLIVLAVVGYYYTGIVLNQRLFYTGCLIGAMVIAHSLAIRWLKVEQKRMALEKEKESRKAESDERPPESTITEAGEEIVIESPTIPIPDAMTIDEQSRKLINTLIGFVLIIGIWSIWADVLPALSFFNEVRLWGTEITDDAGIKVTQWITLQHLALAILTIVLTVAATKNVPGVLEIVLLKNLPLDDGLRYALTTTCRYTLSALGFIVTLNIIGMNWGKIQWLVAAMSVGIGFGLQEIIANFVCGIILLFEQPIRVGDIVTIGDVMGTVTRIRIRATTITNWDRMEYIVPNKELVTGRLFNWTLSNTINRVQIPVGIAYGSDTEKARGLLLNIARDHALVMTDPEPIATFDGFKDSCLNLTLRCYLPDFENRLEVIHQLHSTIHRRFADAGIEIAFPQMDLHFKSMNPGFLKDRPNDRPADEPEPGL